MARDVGARTMRFERLSIEEGLSQSIVNCIFQDSTGFLWLGTQGGLNRYDGNGFTVYRRDAEDAASLSHDLILSVLEDREGDLWIGTEGGGLARWRRATDSFTSYRHDPDDPSSLAGDRVIDLAGDGTGALWVATMDGGLSRLEQVSDADTASFQRFRHDPADPDSLSNDQLGAVYVDRLGVVWIGTWSGLDRYDPERGGFLHYRHDPADSRSLSDDRVRAIVEGEQGVLWVGTLGGLNRLDRRSGTFERYLHDPSDPTSLSDDWVRSLFEDADGRLWVGTDGGLNLWRPAIGGFASYQPDPADPSSLGSGQIVDLFQDHGGVLWISTLGAGLSKWNPRTWSMNHYRSEEGEGASNMVLALSEDAEGGVWVGTYGSGLERIERRGGQVDATGSGVEKAPASTADLGRRTRFLPEPGNEHSLSDDRITTLLHDRRGVLWVGTLDGGLNRFDGGTFERFGHDAARPKSLSSNAVTTLHEDQGGRLWIGTLGGGLNLYHDGGTFTRFRHDPTNPTSLGSDRIFALETDLGGRLWLATDGGGLNRLHPAAGGFLRLRHDPSVPDSLAGDELSAVHMDPSGRLWVGTEGRGLDKLEQLDEATGEARFRNYSRAEGLPDDHVWGIRSDTGETLWIATNNGLARLDPRTDSIKVYTTSHGLQSNEFNMNAHYSSASGELFFGGVNGFNAFFPEEIESNTHVPPIVLTAFTKINRPVHFDQPLFDVGELALTHRDYFFSFEVAALDYTAPSENRVRYKLEGFDDDWVDIGHRRRVTFTNLDPGNYTLRVQGANNAGVWNRQGVSLPILVAPPVWQTWWAYSFYTLALVGVTAGFVHHQHRRVERANQIARRERAQAQDRAALIVELEVKNTELERFNYTVSHDLKSPIVTIKGFLGLLEQDAMRGDVERVKHDIRRIGAATDRMRLLLDELLELSSLGKEARPPAEVSLAELAGEALEVSRGYAGDRAVEVVIDRQLPVIVGDRLRIRQLYQNLLGNAFKYLGDQSAPRVEVGVRHDDGEKGYPVRVLFVKDNGKGIEEHHWERVFGLFERLDAAEEGTGIGLALAKRIVELHGGRIWVESKGPGRGSTFCFTLPGYRIEEDDEQPETAANVVQAGDRFR